MSIRPDGAELSGPALIATMIRAAGWRLALASVVHTAQWVQAPLALALAAPPWVALALGLVLTPFRVLAHQSLRGVLRAKAIERVARRALQRPQAGISEADADMAFWSAHIAEFAVSTTLPTVVATSVTIALSFSLVARAVGARSTLLVLLVLALAALAVVLGTRVLAARASRAIDARRMVSVWLSAALRGGAELRSRPSHDACLQQIQRSIAAWCEADNAFELRRDLLRAGVVAASIVCAVTFAPGAVRAMWTRSASDAALAVALLALLSAGFAATRALSDVMVTIAELRRLDVSLDPGDLAPAHPARLDARPKALVARGVELRYGESVALSCDDWTLPLDGVVLISGPNGAGKSTLAAAISGVLRPSVGALSFACGERTLECAMVEREQLLFVPQEPVMIASLSVRENMKMLVPDASDERLRAALARLGSDIELDRSISALSRGQKHRVGIARALLVEPAVLVLDEPDAWLDAASRAVLVGVLDEESAARCVLVVSHRDDLRSVARTHVLIDAGRVVATQRLA